MNNHIIGLIFLFIINSLVFAGDNVATYRHDQAINTQALPPIIPKVQNEDIRRKRNYPMQPPTIPHKINNYQVDLNTNKCLSCHNRTRIEESQAPMVSVTHFMDRDGNFLANVSPRRYFCLQCHVIQTTAKPVIGNSFVDMDQLLK